ncbi:uncharacterized protein LOC119735737 [Patiria miniata]|uniref:Tyr recombinase domain-containing protein n=1 Tax=Patiria miniata TaxID=46514 RepID=A0A914APN6_PATMI|nr:uncharacterized protein LOC119735737 [Patiria miniata]
MDTASAGCPITFSVDRSASCRPICLSKQPPVTGILRKTQRPLRMADRRTGNTVGQTTCVRLSPVLPHTASTDQSGTGGVQDPPHSSILATPTLVPETHQALGSPPGDSSEEGRHTVPAQLGFSSPGPGGSPPDVLGIIKQSFRTAGLSERAAAIAACSRRESTRKIYNSRLHHFYKWCRARSLRPSDTSIGEIADFLVGLFDSDLATATVKNYRSAIAAIHGGFSDGSSVSDNQNLSQLIKGMFVSRPPTRRLLPSWDLFAVLSALSRPPFEPMGSSTLLQLSVKVSFLLAVATSRRRSELHSLTVETGHIRWEPGGVRLVPKTGFLTKNQSESFSPPDIFVPDIKSFSSVSGDRLWCPVRALKWYIDRTKTLRSGHSQLFITTTPPYRPASRDTISRWLVTAIKSAIDSPTTDSVGSVHAHEVRAASTSWAFFKGVSIKDITQAACWKTPNTFTECYLKDVLQTEGRAGRVVLKAASRASSGPQDPLLPGASLE